MSDYDAVGGLQHALSNHADEAFDALTPEQQRIAEVMFRRLSERSANQMDSRRPTRLDEIAAVAGVSVEDVKPVVEAFRTPARSFLTPGVPQALTATTVIDISHESLIRQWQQLNDWAAAEADSADDYRRLEETAIRWENGIAGLWGSPDLDNALAWREREQPQPVWAQRYGAQFDLALRFLAESQQAQKEQQRQVKQRRQRVIASLLIGILLALGLAFWAMQERGKADRERDRAEAEEQQRTVSLFESYLTHASLQAKIEDYAAAREILKQSYPLDTYPPLSPRLRGDERGVNRSQAHERGGSAIAPERRHARNLLAWYVELMGGTADKVYTGAGVPLYVVAVSPDGKLLAAAGEKGTVVLFDVVSGVLLQRLQGHRVTGNINENTVSSL